MPGTIRLRAEFAGAMVSSLAPLIRSDVPRTFLSSYRAVKRLPRLWQVLIRVGVAATGSDHSTTKFFKRFSAELVFSGALEHHFPRQNQ
jgi:hypothetical protein